MNFGFSLDILSPDILIVFLAFVLLGLITFLNSHLRKNFLSRTRSEWVLDGVSLISQGLFVPIVQTTFVATGLKLLFGSPLNWQLSWISSFSLNFLLIDYLYYWNHRWLHNKMWKYHYVHHTAQHLDVFVTSRNSLITPLLIVYVWAQGFLIWALADAAPFLTAVATSCALDLWRHSSIKTNAYVAKILGAFLILPEDHLWHHSRDTYNVNFGANLNIWDRIHKTFYRPGTAVPALGINDQESLRTKILFPWRIRV